ncbi:MAG TPA: hypothetical protein PKN95_00330 [Verrucomicrobiota bacterium]|nr:hypothetical protein [Verrucomicrobiota bacterium]HNT14454.1 hypothetical protein [Verrucomicrobiota bacterium]
MNTTQSKRHKPVTSVLGLTLDGGRLEGVWLKRTNGAARVAGSFTVTLTLDPLTAAAELVGREIRNHLDAAGIRERRCVVGLPLKWALLTQTQMPALSEPDQTSFLQTEAERNFPCDVATLVTAWSRCQMAGSVETVTFAGMPRDHVGALTAALRAAGLKPLSFALGITALQPPTPEPVLAILLGVHQADLQITCGGGVLKLRSLEGAMDGSGGRARLQPDVMAREVRITLGQLPETIRTGLRRLRVFGPADLGETLSAELQARLAEFGLQVMWVARDDAAAVPGGLEADTPVSPALSLAAGCLAGTPSHWEFLPPQVSAAQQMFSRYGSGKWRKAGLAAAGAMVAVGLAFLGQQALLWHYQSRWDAVKTRVVDLETIQNKIKQFRPWFDKSVRSLNILKQLTQAFPEDGDVTAKTVEIREANQVTCTGTAKDNAALLHTLDRLRQVRSIADLKVNRIQGKTPLQFTFDFRWVEGGVDAH